MYANTVLTPAHGHTHSLTGQAHSHSDGSLIAAAPELLAQEMHHEVGLTQIIADLERAQFAIASAKLGHIANSALQQISYAKGRALAEREWARAAIAKARK